MEKNIEVKQMKLPKLPKLAWIPHNHQYSVLPEEYKPKRTHVKYGDNYQIWTKDALIGIPVLLTEYKAKNDNDARKQMLHRLALSRVGSKSADRGEDAETRAKIYLDLAQHRATKSVWLVNTDSGKKLELPTRKHQLMKDLRKLSHMA